MEDNLVLIIAELLKIIETQIALIMKNKILDLRVLVEKEVILVSKMEKLKNNHKNIEKSIDLLYQLNDTIYKRDYLIKQSLIISNKMFSSLEKENMTYTNYKKNSNKNKKFSSVINQES